MRIEDEAGQASEESPTYSQTDAYGYNRLVCTVEPREAPSESGARNDLLNFRRVLAPTPLGQGAVIGFEKS